jgi:hypothetical protein
VELFVSPEMEQVRFAGDVSFLGAERVHTYTPIAMQYFCVRRIVSVQAAQSIGDCLDNVELELEI